MSRSYKKHMASKYSHSDKWDKQYWHKVARRKINIQTRELETYFGESVYTQIEIYYDYGDDYFFDIDWELTSLFDLYDKPYYDYYDVDCQDTWNWTSDGGSYIDYTKQRLFDKFNKDLREEEQWNEYVEVTTNKLSWLSNNTWWFRLLVNSKNLAGKVFNSKEEMDCWMINNQNYIINVWRKLHFGK